MPFVLPYIFFDPPLVLDASVTPIPASSSLPLQVIADTGLNTGGGFSFIDNTGQLIGVYMGSVGHEVLICICGSGTSGQAHGKFPPGSRISLRAMVNTAITSGTLSGAIFNLR